MKIEDCFPKSILSMFQNEISELVSEDDSEDELSHVEKHLRKHNKIAKHNTGTYRFFLQSLLSFPDIRLVFYFPILVSFDEDTKKKAQKKNRNHQEVRFMCFALPSVLDTDNTLIGNWFGSK